MASRDSTIFGIVCTTHLEAFQTPAPPTKRTALDRSRLLPEAHYRRPSVAVQKRFFRGGWEFPKIGDPNIVL